MGVKNQPVEGTCDSLLSFCYACIWWSKYVVIKCWSSLLGASTGWIPLTWKCGCSYGWTTSWTGCYGAPNLNCFLKPFVTILDIFYYFQTSVNSNFFLSIGYFIDKKTKMQIFKKFQTNFIRNKKLIKTQNNPKKLLKLVQIQTKIFKKQKNHWNQRL